MVNTFIVNETRVSVVPGEPRAGHNTLMQTPAGNHQALGHVAIMCIYQVCRELCFLQIKYL